MKSERKRIHITKQASLAKNNNNNNINENKEFESKGKNESCTNVRLKSNTLHKEDHTNCKWKENKSQAKPNQFDQMAEKYCEKKIKKERKNGNGNRFAYQFVDIVGFLWLNKERRECLCVFVCI